MRNIHKHLWYFIKAHKIWSIIIGLITIAVIWFVISGGREKTAITSVTAEIGTITEEVNVTGNVKPFSDVDLAFERGGKITSLNVAVGDRVFIGQYLASVSNADLMASVDQAKANLKKVQAVFGNDATKTALDFSQTKKFLINTIRDSYTKADDAVRNKMYTLFADPAKYNARLMFVTGNFLREDIEDGKDIISDKLDTWVRSLAKLGPESDLEIYYSEAQTNLEAIKILLDKCAEAVNNLSADTSTTQTQIDTWKLNISTARVNINTTTDNLKSAYDQYKTASLSVSLSKNDNLAEEAGIESAQAQVKAAEAELAKTIIRSPITGVITDIPIKLGEIVSVGVKAISVISYGEYEVESFVPEADISKVKINDSAKITLDAYGDSVLFEAMVKKIDPAATIIDGVPTYKVTFRFTNKDERVRSGMTANLDIVTATKIDVITIPTRAVYTKNNNRFVKILGANDEVTETKVDVGLRGFDGRVEIISGIKVGDRVVTSL